MPEAARQGDSIGHSSAMAGLLVGMAAGVVLAAAVVAVVGTGGVAAVAIGAGIAAAGASGGLAGEYIGEAVQSPTGTILTGSSDTFHEGKPAARAKLDTADCSRHGRNRIAEGSKTVAVNGEPAARRGDHTECGAVIMSGAKTIVIGGPAIQVLPVRQEVPAWLHNSLIAVAIGGTIIATGGAAAVSGIGPAAGGLIGGLAGGWSLGWVGGKVGQAVGEHFGNPELGKRIGEVSFGVIGSFAGGYLGARLGAKVLPARTIPEGGQASNQQRTGKGGPHRETSKPTNDGMDSHHTPAKDAYKETGLDPDDGPAIKMDPKDHRRTASYGSSEEAEAYRQMQRELIQKGEFKKAIELDVNDIRSKFGTKYDDGLQEMQDYADSIDPQELEPRQ